MKLKRIAEKKITNILFLPVEVAYCGMAGGKWDGVGHIAGSNTILE